MIELAPPYRGEANSQTSDEDVSLLLSGDRSLRRHVIEREWLGLMRTARGVAYRLPARTFEPWDRFWISRVAVEPIELVERHASAGIALDADDDLLALCEHVVGSTLDFSGIRLRNASMAI